MSILALDTTGRDCAAALRRSGQDDLIIREAIGRGHAERLAPMVAELLAKSGLSPKELTRIGVTVGPGSFAGTRVGVAFARGLALSSRAKAYGISNLAIWAQNGPDTSFVVAHDAKRGEVIIQTWSHQTGTEPQRMTVEAASVLIGDRPVIGPGAALFGGEDAGALDLAALLDLTETAPGAASPPIPFYARPPDAKLPGGIEP